MEARIKNNCEHRLRVEAIHIWNCPTVAITCAEASLVVRVCSTKTIKLSMALSLSSAQPFFAGSAQSGFISGSRSLSLSAS